MTHAPAVRRRRTRRTALLAVALLGALCGVVACQAVSPALSLDPLLAGAGAAEADGGLPEGATPFDEQYPAIARLDPALRAAVQQAADDAAAEGVAFVVTSGWRSPAYQEELLREAVAEHGSAEEAARWVATAETSPHVSGGAVDIGHAEAMDWLSVHGERYDLCRIYANEPWHFELRPGASTDGCPAAYPDPTADPRMQG